MRTITPHLVLLLALLLFSCSTSDEQQANFIPISKDPTNIPNGTTFIAGKLLDAQTRTPIQGALVESLSPTENVQTRGAGTFALINNVTDNEVYRIFASHPDYGDQTTTVFTTPNQANTADLLLVPKANVSPLTISPPSLLLSHTQHSTLAKLSNPTNTPLQWCIPHTPFLRITPSFGTLQANTNQQLRVSFNADIYPSLIPSSTSFITTQTPFELHEIPTPLLPNSCQTDPSPPQRLRITNTLITLNPSRPYTVQTTLRSQDNTPLCTPNTPCSVPPSKTIFAHATLQTDTTQQPISNSTLRITLHNTTNPNTPILDTRLSTNTDGSISFQLSNPQDNNAFLPPGTYTLNIAPDWIKDPSNSNLFSPNPTTFTIAPPTQTNLSINTLTNSGTQDDPFPITQRNNTLTIQHINTHTQQLDTNPTTALLNLNNTPLQLDDDFEQTPDGAHIIPLESGTRTISFTYTGPDRYDAYGEPNTDNLTFEVTTRNNQPNSTTRSSFLDIQTSAPEILDAFEISFNPSNGTGSQNDPFLLTAYETTLTIRTIGSRGGDNIPIDHPAFIDFGNLPIRINNTPASSTPILFTEGTSTLSFTYDGPFFLDPYDNPNPAFIDTLHEITVREELNNPTPPRTPVQSSAFLRTAIPAPEVFKDAVLVLNDTILEPESTTTLTSRDLSSLTIQLRGSRNTTPFIVEDNDPRSFNFIYDAFGPHLDPNSMQPFILRSLRNFTGAIRPTIGSIYAGPPGLNAHGDLGPIPDAHTLTLTIQDTTQRDNPAQASFHFQNNIQHEGFNTEIILSKGLVVHVVDDANADPFNANVCDTVIARSFTTPINPLDPFLDDPNATATLQHDSGHSFTRNAVIYEEVNGSQVLAANAFSMSTLRDDDKTPLNGSWSVSYTIEDQNGWISQPLSTSTTFSVTNIRNFSPTERLFVELWDRLPDEFHTLDPNPQPPEEQHTPTVGQTSFLRILYKDEVGCGASNRPLNIGQLTPNTTLPFQRPCTFDTNDVRCTPSHIQPIDGFRYLGFPQGSDPLTVTTGQRDPRSAWFHITPHHTGTHTLPVTVEGLTEEGAQTNITFDVLHSNPEDPDTTHNLHIDLTQQGIAHTTASNTNGQPLKGFAFVHDPFGNPLPNWDISAFAGSCPTSAYFQTPHTACLSLNPTPLPLGTTTENQPYFELNLHSIRHHVFEAFNDVFSPAPTHEGIPGPTQFRTQVTRGPFIVQTFATHTELALQTTRTISPWFYPNITQNSEIFAGHQSPTLISNDTHTATLSTTNQPYTIRTCLREPNQDDILDNEKLNAFGLLSRLNHPDDNILLTIRETTPNPSPLLTEPVTCSFHLNTPSGTLVTSQNPLISCTMTPVITEQLCLDTTISSPSQPNQHTLELSIQLPTSPNPLSSNYDSILPLDEILLHTLQLNIVN